jgi:hypothetical protein
VIPYQAKATRRLREFAFNDRVYRRVSAAKDGTG